MLLESFCVDYFDAQLPIEARGHGQHGCGMVLGVQQGKSDDARLCLGESFAWHQFEKAQRKKDVSIRTINRGWGMCNSGLIRTCTHGPGTIWRESSVEEVSTERKRRNNGRFV